MLVIFTDMDGVAVILVPFEKDGVGGGETDSCGIYVVGGVNSVTDVELVLLLLPVGRIRSVPFEEE